MSYRVDPRGRPYDVRGTPPYSFYSLRHYFATMRLQEGGVDVFALAKIMGTSVKNIENHYGQILVREMGDELIRRKRR